MKEIRLLDDLGYGGRALSKNDMVAVGTGKDAIDAETAALWVQQGHALADDPATLEGPDLAGGGTHVVVHERGGQELLQGMTTVTKTGRFEGPADENPTDSDLKADTEAGASRTAAGAVIAENADPAAAKAASKTAKRR
ncbi:MAG: hypothetical protein M3Q39_09130 [Actinomycetota bacterium]|nr:hypothetical protein [Actinomycetota bacterium]